MGGATFLHQPAADWLVTARGRAHRTPGPWAPSNAHFKELVYVASLRRRLGPTKRRGALELLRQ